MATRFLALLISLILSGSWFLYQLPSFSIFSEPLTFHSFESKTTKGHAVYNEIQYVPGDRADIWVMRQSHNGLDAPKESWDRVAIQVDKTKRSARFFQLQPGSLGWNKKDGVINYKVSCFSCHSNGLRVVRPHPSQNFNWKQKVQIAFWNLRIKSYGRLKNRSSRSRVPLSYTGDFANTPLTLKTCTRCHRESGFLSRGKLYRQHRGTIMFLVENKLMPPFGLPFSKKEKVELKKFLFPERQ